MKHFLLGGVAALCLSTTALAQPGVPTPPPGLPGSIQDGASVTLGTKADPKSTATDTTPGSEIALLKGAIDRLSAVITTLNTPFQAGGSIGNTGFNALGSAGTPFDQGTGVISPNTMRVGVAGGSIANTGFSALGSSGVALKTAGDGTVLIQAQNQTGYAFNVSGLLPPGQSTTTSGLSVSHVVSAATTNAAVARGFAGRLYDVDCYNAGSSAAYFRIFNLSAAPTPGTSSVELTLGIPPSGRATTAANDIGVYNATGIAYDITGGLADTDTTATAAAQVVCNIRYY